MQQRSISSSSNNSGGRDVSRSSCIRSRGAIEVLTAAAVMVEVTVETTGAAERAMLAAAVEVPEAVAAQ